MCDMRMCSIEIISTTKCSFSPPAAAAPEAAQRSAGQGKHSLGSEEQALRGGGAGGGGVSSPAKGWWLFKRVCVVRAPLSLSLCLCYQAPHVNRGNSKRIESRHTAFVAVVM